MRHLWDARGRQAWLAALTAEFRVLAPHRLVCDDSGWAHVVTDLNDYHEYYAVPERIARFRQRLDFIEAHPGDNFSHGYPPAGEPMLVSRSEERRVGKECRSRWSPYH